MNEQGRTIGVSGVLGIAAGVSAAVGIALAALFERDKDESASIRGVRSTREAVEVSRRRISDESARGRERFRKWEDQVKHLETKDLSKRASKAVDGSRKTIEAGIGRLGESAPAVVERGRTAADHVRAVADDAYRHAPDVLSSLEKRAHPAWDSAKERLVPVARDAVERASATAVPAIEDAIEHLHPRAEHFRESVGDVAQTVAQTAQTVSKVLQEHSGPLAHDVSDSAKSLLATGRDTAADSRRRFESEVLPEAKAVGGRLLETAAEQSRELGTHLHDLEGKLATVSHEAIHRAESAGSVIEDRSRHAASAAGRGSRDAGSLVLWGAAAASLAYYAFLDPDQRAKVRAAGARILTEAKAIYQDVKGHDGDFSGSA